MQKPLDDSKACPAAFAQASTLVAVIEMSLSSWLVSGMITAARSFYATAVGEQVSHTQAESPRQGKPCPFHAVC
jgi:hypothetical protein